MRVCQGRNNIEAQTTLESVDDTINRNMRVCQEKIHIEAQTKLESLDDTNRNMRVCQGRINIEAQTKLESLDYTINRNEGSAREGLISRHKPH